LGELSTDLGAKTSKFVTETYEDDEGKIRVRIRSSRETFDAEAKQLFLEAYAEHGRMTHAAHAAGVTRCTVNRHLKKDPDFAEACVEAEGTYKDRLIEHHQNLVFEGTTKYGYDRQGNIVSEEKIYPIRLIELELKKHDEGYREKREVDLNVTGGVMVAPAAVQSIDDWESRFAGKTIEGEAQEIPDGKSDESGS
jgi:hypothetical protein